MPLHIFPAEPMHTTIQLHCCPAQSMAAVADASVDLVVTSPPYPMVKMWDEPFIRQDERIGTCLSSGDGATAFAHMHAVLDDVWAECARVMKPGAMACINVGDATRTLDGDFQLYANHARILHYFVQQGFAVLPDILWRKQTNAPSKFMGSGMLPVGAYVTYEHEYILILRKGRRREFVGDQAKARRRASAFFWEERNIWFSDLWSDIKGTAQQLGDGEARERSAAFPFELAHRLISMFSVKGDMVLDPFAGTGTTLAAALATARNAVGIELEEALLPVIRDCVVTVAPLANAHNHARLVRHGQWVEARVREKGPLKHTNRHYGFPVVTAQERELLLNDVVEVVVDATGTNLRASYQEQPQWTWAANTPGDAPGATVGDAAATLDTTTGDAASSVDAKRDTQRHPALLDPSRARVPARPHKPRANSRQRTAAEAGEPQQSLQLRLPL